MTLNPTLFNFTLPINNTLIRDFYLLLHNQSILFKPQVKDDLLLDCTICRNTLYINKGTSTTLRFNKLETQNFRQFVAIEP